LKAIILSAGQGRRLLPLTEELPKCALALAGRSILGWQIDQLARGGVEEIVVVTGFGAERVEDDLRSRPLAAEVRTLFNPFYELADNLASCWEARGEMTGDFLLLNGDTLFESEVLRRVLDAPHRPVTVATDVKSSYDADDMKVRVDGERLVRVGKDLPLPDVDGESIGMLLFRGGGAAWFRNSLERAIRRPQALRQWYLSVVDEMARTGRVSTASVHPLSWVEVDTPSDLARARDLIERWAAASGALQA
jgi:choline kinase